MTEQEQAAYDKGYEAGHAKGLASGEAIGYSDARYRAHLAVDTLTHTVVARGTIDAMRDAITAIVGKRTA